MKKVRFLDNPDLEPYYPGEPQKQIDAIQFSIWRSEDIQKTRVEINSSEIYDYDTNFPIENGPLDLRLGLSEKREKRCETCGEDMRYCPGHFGYINLELPVFHVGLFKHAINILQSICKCCGRLLLNEADRQKYKKKLLAKKDSHDIETVRKEIQTMCKKVKICPFCETHNGSVKKDPTRQALKVVHDLYNLKTVPDDILDDFIQDFDYQCQVNSAMTARDMDIRNILGKTLIDMDPLKVQSLFEKIVDDDIKYFNMDVNLCKPADMLLSCIPAPPNCIRPTVLDTHGVKNEDDLTMKLREIIARNQVIKQGILDGMEPHLLMKEWYYLQCLVALYLNSETPGLPKDFNSQRGIRAFNQRLKGKQGRFRKNLLGKRVDFTGRTVISPDPNCAIDEVIVPVHMAKKLTYPERVNRYNYDKLKNLILKGSETHPGANFVIQQPIKDENLDNAFKDGFKLYLKGRTKNQRQNVVDELKFGDVVERHLEDGDTVLFNRQPSLHRVSIMAHKARVMPFRTLRFNECCCKPYNADFDGDEMNIHLPQTEEARAEARTLMNVKNNLMIPKSGDPLVSATQDFLTSSYLITFKDRFLNRAEFMKLCAYFGDAEEQIEIPPPAILKPVELWTGKQIINVMLRPNRASKVFVNATVKEKFYSDKEQMCIQDGYIVFKNSELMCGCLGKVTMGSESKKGLMYALIRDNSVEIACKCMLRVSKFSSRWLSNYGMSIGIGDVTPFPQFLGLKQQMLDVGYKKCTEEIQKYDDQVLETNPGCNMEESLESNLNGILSKIREEAGKTLIKMLPKYNAPLIMEQCGSKGSLINVSQMISCVGQQIVSGKRMPDGFFDRPLPHFQHNSKRPADKGFVANSFYQGLTATEFFFHTIGGREGLVDTAVKTAETGYMQRKFMKALEDISIKYDDTVRMSSEHIVQFKYGDDGLDPTYMDDNKQPVSFQRLHTIIKERMKNTEADKKDHMMTPEEIENGTKKSIEDCQIRNVSDKFKEDFQEFVNSYLVNEIQRIRQSFGLKSFEKDGLTLARLKQERKDHFIQEELRKNKHVTFGQFKEFTKLVWKKYTEAIIQPGECVGAICAQSIGEPGTQMTLKTFHFAGVASMNITLGVPRIKEIVEATKEISTPIIEAQLVNDDVLPARVVKGRLETTYLKDICKHIKEVFSPKGCYLSIKLDKAIMQALQLELTIQDIQHSILKTRSIKLKETHVKIKNEEKIHVQPYDQSKEKMYFVMQTLLKMLPEVIVNGISSLKRAVIKEIDLKSMKNKKVDDGLKHHELAIEGTGLEKVLRTPGVEYTKTKTNSVIEMEDVLGIEAARKTIIDQIKYTMGEHGIKIDIRHILLLADVMTFKGKVLGINRHGVHKMKNSTLMLASFECTTDHLYDAAVHCKKDEITGVSECIITGNMASLGTGAFKLLQDDSIKPMNNYKNETIAQKNEFVKNYKVQDGPKRKTALLFDSFQ